MSMQKGIAGFARNAVIMLLRFYNEFLNHYALIIMVYIVDYRFLFAEIRLYDLPRRHKKCSLELW